MENRSLTICHLYPEIFKLHGDRGNVICLKKRLEWRGINCKVMEKLKGSEIQEADIYYIGSGQEYEQLLVLDDFINIKQFLLKEIDNGKVVLAIAGAMELFGQSKEIDNEFVEYSHILNFTLQNGGNRNPGNYSYLIEGIDEPVVAYENHAAKLFLGEKEKALGKILTGRGNNGEDSTEGIRRGNFFGTYGQGPLLSKNPKLTDLLLETAIRNKYASDSIISFAQLDDNLEKAANAYMLKRLKNE
ncbi:MAG: type 1 glutamine amidotransferase [Anaerovoracaceae bacterium]